MAICSAGSCPEEQIMLVLRDVVGRREVWVCCRLLAVMCWVRTCSCVMVHWEQCSPDCNLDMALEQHSRQWCAPFVAGEGFARIAVRSLIQAAWVRVYRLLHGAMGHHVRSCMTFTGKSMQECAG